MAQPSSKPRGKRQPTSNAWDWSPVDPLQVLIVTQDRKMLLGDEPITDIELKNLQSEVKALKNFRIWRIFQDTIKQKSIELGFVKADNWEQTMSGKMMLHNLGILRSVLEVIERTPGPATAPVAPRPAQHTPMVHPKSL